MQRIGLIAGNRRFPLLFAQAARKSEAVVVVFAIKGEASRNLKRFSDKIYWLGLPEFPRLLELLRSEDIKDVVMAGQVSPRRLFSREVRQSPALQELLQAVKDKRADTIFGAIAERLKAEGLNLMDSTTFLKESLVTKGILNSGALSPDAWEDINFGFRLAKEVAGLDIGQTVAVKEKAIVAVEGLEGTDNLIRRSGRLAGGGLTIVKVAKPKQDLRFDIPVIGLNTIRNLARAKARCLAVEAGKVLFLDKEPALKLASAKGIVIAGV